MPVVAPAKILMSGLRGVRVVTERLVSVARCIVGAVGETWPEIRVLTASQGAMRRGKESL